MKRIIALIMVLCSVFALTACTQTTPKASEQPTASAQTETSTPPAQESAPVDTSKVYKFNVSFAAPEMATTEVTATLNRIQEASKGRIEFTYYYSWSITNPMSVVDDLNSGVVDVAAVPLTEHTNIFPYANLVSYLPFLGLPSPGAMAEIYDELYAEFDVLKQEYSKAGLTYWTNYPMPGYNIYTTEDHAVKTPADMKGLKLISSSKLMQDFITANGGAAVATPVTEYATSLNTNVVDGLINHANVVAAFGCMDFIKGATIFGDSGTAMSMMVMCISTIAWESLPADLQQLFTAEAVALRDGQNAADTAMHQGILAGLEAKGGVTRLTEDEIAVWSEAFKPMREAYIQDLIKNGSTEAQVLYDALQKKIAG